MICSKHFPKVEFSQRQHWSTNCQDVAQAWIFRVELRRHVRWIRTLRWAPELQAARFSRLYVHYICFERVDDYSRLFVSHYSRSSAISLASVRISRVGSDSGAPKSIGRRILRPNASLYGVNPVDYEIVDRYVCSTGASRSFQSYGRFWTAWRSIATKVRLNLSNFPFAWGRYYVVLIFSIPQVAQWSANIAASNCPPWSECSCSHTPYRAICSAYTTRSTVEADWSGIGIASAQTVRTSIIVKIDFGDALIDS